MWMVRNNVDIAKTAKAGNWKSKRLLLENYTHAEGVQDAVDNVFSSPIKPTFKIVKGEE